MASGTRCAIRNSEDVSSVACKQVTNIAGVNANQARYNKEHDPASPSCGVEDETCRHVLYCREEGRIKALNCTIGILDGWMKKVGTFNLLRQCIIEYARGRGEVSMEHVVIRKGARFHELGQSVDRIGWRRFMEGMVLNEIVTLQAEFVALGNCSLSLDDWVK